MGTIDQVDHKISGKKFFDRPIYFYPTRELTPTKREKKIETDNTNKIRKEHLKNNQDNKEVPKSKEKDKSKEKGNANPKLKSGKLKTRQEVEHSHCQSKNII